METLHILNLQQYKIYVTARKLAVIHLSGETENTLNKKITREQSWEFEFADSLIVVRLLFDLHLLVKELTAVCFSVAVAVSITGADGEKASGHLTVTCNVGAGEFAGHNWVIYSMLLVNQNKFHDI
jgi:hypothetical protein